MGRGSCLSSTIFSFRICWNLGKPMSQQNLPAARQHATSGPSSPALPEPGHAERVRTLLSLAPVGTLSTMSRKHPGFPFGSLMPFALDDAGRPIFLISDMAMHTQNLKNEPRCSLFVGETLADGDPLGSARATLVGNAEALAEEEIPSAREIYLARHENSRYWADFSDFRFYRLQPIELYYVGGFGVMGWVNGEDYAAAVPDPLAKSAPGILAHMNADHVSAMVLLARAKARMEASSASMTGVDRLGFLLRLTTSDGMKGIRINFPEEARTPQDVRRMLVEMVRQAEAIP
jgi:heme iron utilization protein